MTEAEDNQRRAAVLELEDRSDLTWVIRKWSSFGVDDEYLSVALDVLEQEGDQAFYLYLSEAPNILNIGDRVQTLRGITRRRGGPKTVLEIALDEDQWGTVTELDGSAAVVVFDNGDEVVWFAEYLGDLAIDLRIDNVARDFFKSLDDNFMPQLRYFHRADGEEEFVDTVSTIYNIRSRTLWVGSADPSEFVSTNYPGSFERRNLRQTSLPVAEHLVALEGEPTLIWDEDLQKHLIMPLDAWKKRYLARHTVYLNNTEPWERFIGVSRFTEAEGVLVEVLGEDAHLLTEGWLLLDPNQAWDYRWDTPNLVESFGFRWIVNTDKYIRPEE